MELTPGVSESPTSVRMFRAKTGRKKSAVFRFEDVKADERGYDGLTMTDEEGSFVTSRLQVRFADGKFQAIEALFETEVEAEWERFMRFMERFSESNDMGMA